jgi:hypothetical protein
LPNLWVESVTITLGVSCTAFDTPELSVAFQRDECADAVWVCEAGNAIQHRAIPPLAPGERSSVTVVACSPVNAHHAHDAGLIRSPLQQPVDG